MSGRVDAAVKAALAELNRQHQEDREGTPYVFDDDQVTSVGIDGRVDLVKVVEAILAASDRSEETLRKDGWTIVENGGSGTSVGGG